MICPNCKHEVEENARFCGECGAPIAQRKFCPECGAALKPGEMVCANCRTGKKRKVPGITAAVLLIAVLVLIAAAVFVGIRLIGKPGDEKTAGTEPVIGSVPAQEETAQKEAEQEETEEPETLFEEEPEEASSQETRYVIHGEAAQKPEIVEEEGIHRYEYVVKDCTWEEAFEEAIAKGGYLVRINSEEEYDFILQEIEDLDLKKVHFYLGGRRDEDGFFYYWVDKNNELYGEALNGNDGIWCADAWLDGEPSFRDGDVEERYLNIFYYRAQDRWIWNDVSGEVIDIYSGMIGYVVEYE